MMRWALGLAILFALLALAARVMQFGFSIALIAVAAVALVAAVISGLAGRATTRSGPPDRSA